MLSPNPTVCPPHSHHETVSSINYISQHPTPADEFVPLQSILQGYDEVDQFIEEANVDFDYHDQRAHERVDDMVLKESLRLKLDSYDDTAEPHNPCTCHNILRGSCPEFKQYHVDRIARGLLQTGLTPNMDGLKEPLRYLSFPVATWEKALHGYFDTEEITRSFRYGWDVSFTQRPIY